MNHRKRNHKWVKLKSYKGRHWHKVTFTFIFLALKGLRRLKVIKNYSRNLAKQLLHFYVYRKLRIFVVQTL